MTREETKELMRKLDSVRREYRKAAVMARMEECVFIFFPGWIERKLKGLAGCEVTGGRDFLDLSCFSEKGRPAGVYTEDPEVRHPYIGIIAPLLHGLAPAFRHVPEPGGAVPLAVTLSRCRGRGGKAAVIHLERPEGERQSRTAQEG